MYENFHWMPQRHDEVATLSKRSRMDDKFEMDAALLAIGRNVAFGGGKGGGGGSSPDPQIGAAALKQADTGQQWLDFAKQQFNIGNERQQDIDALANEVSRLQLDAQKQSNQWATEDRQVSEGLRDKYIQWSDEDRALGRDTKKELDALGNQATQQGDRFAGTFEKAAGQAQQLGQQTGDALLDISGKAQQSNLNDAKTYANLGNAAQAAGDRAAGVLEQQASDQYKLGDQQQNRYTDQFAQVEDRIASDAMNWDSQGRLNEQAAQAKADVMQSAAQARSANERSMASMGINPTSGRFAAMNRATDVQTALAAAGAQNQARDNVRAQAQGMRAQAAAVGQQVLSTGQQANTLGMQATQGANAARNQGIAANMQGQGMATDARNQGYNMGMQGQQAANAAKTAGISLGMQGNQAAHSALMSGQSQAMQAKNLGLAAAGVGNSSAQLGLSNQGAGYTGIGTGLNAGNAAMGTLGNANSQWANNNQIMGQGFGGAMQGYAGQASTLNAQWSNQIAQQQANNANAGGLMAGIGSIAGAGITAYF